MSRRSSAAHHDEGAGYWPSFVDIMAVVVLVLLFVLVTSFIQAGVSIQQRVVGRAKVQELMDKRLTVTRQLEEHLGREYVEIGSDGNIAFRGDVLFHPDSAVLRNTREVDALMLRLATGIGNVLENPQIREGLHMILVEGHTANDWHPPASHWSLSAERARQIVIALQAKDERLLDPKNAQFLGAAARANYRPAKEGDTEEAKSQNRRVEIRLVLRDEGLRDALLEALSN